MGYIGGGLRERPCAAIFVLNRHLGCWTLNVSVTTYLLFMTNNKRKMYNKKWVSGYFNHSLIAHLSVKSCDRWRQNSDAVLQFLERTACSNFSYWGGRKLQCQCTACDNCSPLMIWWIAHVQIAADKLGLSSAHCREHCILSHFWLEMLKNHEMILANWQFLCAENVASIMNGTVFTALHGKNIVKTITSQKYLLKTQ